MSLVDGLLIGGSIFAIILILVAEARRGRAERTTKLHPHVFAIRITLGIVCVFLGILGAVLPILQGWVFFGLAALLLFPQSKFAVKAIDKLEPRFPRVVGWLHRLGVGLHREQDGDRDTIGTR